MVLSRVVGRVVAYLEGEMVEVFLGGLVRVVGWGGGDWYGMVCGVGEVCEVWDLVLWKRARGYWDGTFLGGRVRGCCDGSVLFVIFRVIVDIGVAFWIFFILFFIVSFMLPRYVCVI